MRHSGRPHFRDASAGGRVVCTIAAGAGTERRSAINKHVSVRFFAKVRTPFSPCFPPSRRGNVITVTASLEPASARVLSWLSQGEGQSPSKCEGEEGRDTPL